MNRNQRDRERAFAEAYEQLTVAAAFGNQTRREILLADSTVFSTLFGADDSLKQFWTNLATVK